MQIIGTPLGYIMKLCYAMVKNYGGAIILFTVITKILLLPMGVWVHKNGIKIVKLQPTINRLRAKYFGDQDKIAEEQALLYKQERYNPLASLIPLTIQIVLLMGLIDVIYHPLRYILQFPQEVIDSFNALAAGIKGIDPAMASVELSTIHTLRDPVAASAFLGLSGQISGQDIAYYISAAQAFQMDFLFLDVSLIPNIVHGIMIISPLIAGLSALLLCLVQNKFNVLQAEQGKVNQLVTMAISVGLSLYLGWFVPFGVAIYWTASNLLAILQLFGLNYVINPKRYVDYKELEESRTELAALVSMERKAKLSRNDPTRKREKADYKRFFSIYNKHLVFYSEKSGFYKYYETTIDYLLEHSNVAIHYVTNDPNDQIFEKARENPKIKPYYIGPVKIIPLMMKMDADIVVMTTPDFENYHIKRSYMRQDIEYIFMFHSMTSTNMADRKGSFDHFDTIFCVGQHQIDELRETEALYDLPKKTLVPIGYNLLDSLMEAYEGMEKKPAGEKRMILVAPSWQEDNILDSCVDDLIASLADGEYRLIIRPHPEYVKRFPAKVDALLLRYTDRMSEEFIIETDFSSNATIFTADLVITDWSSIAQEFSYTTGKPSLFIDTPMKVLNPDYDRYQNAPQEMTLRNVIGISLPVEEASGARAAVERLFADQDAFRETILRARDAYVFNLGHSGQAAAEYILTRLIERKEAKTEKAPD